LVAAFSFVAAMSLVWLLGTRELLGHLSNAQLAGMIALALLPPVTIAAWELDRRASARRGVAAPSEPASAGVKTHTAAVRAARPRHRRRIVHARAQRLIP
jgi:hypothetical protein